MPPEGRGWGSGRVCAGDGGWGGGAELRNWQKYALVLFSNILARNYVCLILPRFN
jgi:hypothetical protein